MLECCLSVYLTSKLRDDFRVIYSRLTQFALPSLSYQLLAVRRRDGLFHKPRLDHLHTPSITLYSHCLRKTGFFSVQKNVNFLHLRLFYLHIFGPQWGGVVCGICGFIFVSKLMSIFFVQILFN